MNSEKKNKGFTLIELLVVIAIIGILAAVILAAFTSSKGKANDAKVKSQLSSIPAAALLYYDTNSNYGPSTLSCSGGMFATSNYNLSNLTSSSNYPPGTTLSCQSNGTNWAIQATLPSGNGYQCIDSTGAVSSAPSAFLDPGGTHTYMCSYSSYLTSVNQTSKDLLNTAVSAINNVFFTSGGAGYNNQNLYAMGGNYIVPGYNQNAACGSTGGATVNLLFNNINDGASGYTNSGIRNILNMSNYPSGTIMICANQNSYGRSNNVQWAIQISLVGGGYYCVDKTGVMKNVNTQMNIDATNPNSVFLCPAN